MLCSPSDHSQPSGPPHSTMPEGLRRHDIRTHELQKGKPSEAKGVPHPYLAAVWRDRVGKLTLHVTEKALCHPEPGERRVRDSTTAGTVGAAAKVQQGE